MQTPRAKVRPGLLSVAIAIAMSVPALAVAEKKPEHPTEGPALKYEGAPSGISPEQTKDMITSEGPAMSVEEFDQAKRIFFERCAGCHVVLRKGATGKPLTTYMTRDRGDV